MSSQAVTRISAHSGARGSAAFTLAASPKYPAITASAFPRPRFRLGDEPGVERPNPDDEHYDAQDECLDAPERFPDPEPPPCSSTAGN